MLVLETLLGYITPNAYKKCSNISFFWRRLGFKKENLMKLFRVRVFFLHLLI